MSVGRIIPLPHGLCAEVISYTDTIKAWLARSGHYLENPPPGCIHALAVRDLGVGLCGVAVANGPILGLILIGRPTARMLPQDGSVGEIKRLVLMPGLPHGTASALIRAAADVAQSGGMVRLISYHDRSRHTGCIYKKAGFRKAGVTAELSDSARGWATRTCVSGEKKHGHGSKRRWILDL